MALKDAPQCTAKSKSTGKQCCNPAVTGFKVCRVHGAGGKKKPGGRPATHGRYSRLKREHLRSLIEEYEQDPDPLNILPELAAARALFQDFTDRYDEFTEALVAWHQSYQAGSRPIDKYKVEAFIEVVDQYEELIRSEDDLTERQQKTLSIAREFVKAARQEAGTKPIQILDISDAYRIVSEITKIVERIEKIRSQNAVSRPDLVRVMTEMARTVETFVSDKTTLEKIKTGWLSVKI
jgi:hypothetical protein